MKRARRLGLREGLSGKVRRRLARRMRDLAARRWPPTFVRGDADFRDVRRLHEAGLVAVAVSRHGWVGPRELAVDLSRARLKSQYRTVLAGGPP